jgi:hypothetical protein
MKFLQRMYPENVLEMRGEAIRVIQSKNVRGISEFVFSSPDSSCKKRSLLKGTSVAGPCGTLVMSWTLVDGCGMNEAEELIVRLPPMDSTISTVMHRFSSEHRS